MLCFKNKKQQRQVTVRVERPGYSTHVFEVPASDLSSAHYAPLMAAAEKAYGVQQGDVITIPCNLRDFVHAMVSTASGAPVRVEPSPPPQVVGDEQSWRMMAVKDGYVDEVPLTMRYSLGWYLARPH